MKKYEFKGKQFHEECFCCKVCRQPIGVKTFIPREQEAVCVPCYEEQYAQRCIKCNGVCTHDRLLLVIVYKHPMSKSMENRSKQTWEQQIVRILNHENRGEDARSRDCLPLIWRL